MTEGSLRSLGMTEGSLRSLGMTALSSRAQSRDLHFPLSIHEFKIFDGLVERSLPPHGAIRPFCGSDPRHPWSVVGTPVVTCRSLDSLRSLGMTEGVDRSG